jgi:hypothetical protein
MIGALNGFIGALNELIPQTGKPAPNVAATQSTVLNKFIEVLQNLEIELLYYVRAKSFGVEEKGKVCCCACMVLRALACMGLHVTLGSVSRLTG